MDMGKIIYDRLTGNAGVAALVATRVYPDEAPDDADLPLVVYGVQLSDQNDGTAPMKECTITAHGWAASDSTAQSLAEALHAALEGYNGQADTTALRCLTLTAYDEERSFEMNVWGRLLTYSGLVVLG
jgi:hypothetical protein